MAPGTRRGAVLGGLAVRAPGEGPAAPRVHDAFLGGKDAYAVDQAVVARLRQVSDGMARAAMAARTFAAETVAGMAAEGVDQFIDLGCGYPTPHAPEGAALGGGNVHEIAQRHNPGARVVYADNDTGVIVHSRALLGDQSGVGVVFGDARDVHGLITHPLVRRMLDLRRPVTVLLVHLLEFLDDPAAARLLNGLRSTLPTGSHLVLTHTTDDALPARERDALNEAVSLYSGFVTPYRIRRHRALGALLGDWALLPPGLTGFEPPRAEQPSAPVMTAIARLDARPARDGQAITGTRRRGGDAQI